MRRVVLAVACVLFMLPAAAQAQLLTVGLPGSATPVAFKPLVARVTGQVSISFHSDAGTGCAALSACAYSGTVAWAPNGGGVLDLVQYQLHHRPHAVAFLGFGANSPGSLTATTVRRSSQGQCADEQAGLSFLPAAEHGANQTFALTGVLLPTRCAGPVPADLAAALPRVTIATRRLEAGHVRLDFHARRSFASHGFAGTITSTFVVAVGGALPPGPSGPAPPAGQHSQLIRIVTETLHAGVGGSLRDAISGSSNPDVCVLLDACGLSGMLTISPKPAAPKAELTASGPASRPYRDFLTALGLSRAGNAAGIAVTGDIQWRDAGMASEVVHQSGSCSDAAPLGDGFVSLVVTRRRIAAQYGLGIGLGDVTTARTRCPGPTSVGANGALAGGSVSRSRLRQRTFTITLPANGALGDEGYTVRSGGAITLELRRGRVRQTVERIPVLAF